MVTPWQCCLNQGMAPLSMQNIKLNGDITAGILFILFGGWFCVSAILGLPFGSAFRMGPGFFPTMVGGLLLALGAVIVVNGVVAQAEEVDLSAVPWRAVILFPVGLVVFGAAMRPLGLLIALLALCFCSAMAVRGMTLVRAAILSVGVSAVCVAVFSFALGLNLPLVGDWLR